jgi:hypothetical protein
MTNPNLLQLALCNDPVGVVVKISESYYLQQQHTLSHYKGNINQVNDDTHERKCQLLPSSILLLLNSMTAFQKQFKDCKELFSVCILLAAILRNARFIELKPGVKPYHCTRPYHITSCDASSLPSTRRTWNINALYEAFAFTSLQHHVGHVWFCLPQEGSWLSQDD